MLIKFFFFLSFFFTFNFVKPENIIELEKVVAQLPFDNPSGGAWKQGWNVQYDPNSVDEKPLQVFMVLFSHCDPGWLMTPEEYYNAKTKNIITTVVNELYNDPELYFIWSEISYFSMWWNDQNEIMKQKAETIIKKGQLEFVTGGWVMNDEATTHYDSILNQLTTGHEWLRENLKVQVKPRYGWSIDPFGHSPIQAYFYSLMGFEGMLISRVHYAMKKYLAKKSSMEFYWRPTWKWDSSADIFTHLMPFYHYDFPHTCGPDPSVCSLYEFGRKTQTAWKRIITPVNNENLPTLSANLLDQHRKKNVLYRTRNVLNPFGDDFTYVSSKELLTITENLKQIFKYVNNNPDYNAHIRFSNLSSYFDSAKSVGKQVFPIVQGDFFSYADRNSDYWTGYYTSRPFYKGFDRIVQHTLRAAEILFSIVVSRFGFSSQPRFQTLFKSLQEARNFHSIFQHHDGITGTSKDHVVLDYGNKLQKSWWNAKNVMKDLLPLVAIDNFQPDNVIELEIPESEPNASSHIPVQHEVDFLLDKSPKQLIFYNSLTHQRHQMVEVIVNSPQIRVYDMEKNSVSFQINPLWEKGELNSKKFQVFFVTSVPAFGYSVYTLKLESNIYTYTIPQVTILNSPSSPQTFLNKPILKKAEDLSLYQFSNDYMHVQINPHSGLLQSISIGDDTIQLEEQLMSYNSTHSGAYLFLPIGSASPLNCKPIISLVKGPLIQESRSLCLSMGITVITTIRLFLEGENKFVQVKRYIDLKQNNKEVIVRYSSNLESEKYFYTDLNGFAMQRRFRRDDLPIQHNYYPSTSLVFLQDKTRRLSFHTTQSLALGSVENGSVEFMLDRRVPKDDDRGLGQGVTDNVPNEITFFISVDYLNEQRSPLKNSPSIYSNWLNLILNHPLHMYFIRPGQEKKLNYFTVSAGCIQDLPVDIHFISFKMRNPHESSAVLWQVVRLPADSSIENLSRLRIVTESGITLANTMTFLRLDTIEQWSLTFLHVLYKGWSSDAIITFQPYEIKAFILTFKPTSHNSKAGSFSLAEQFVAIKKLQEENDQLKEKLRNSKCETIQFYKYLMATIFLGILLLTFIIFTQKRIRYISIFGIVFFIGVNIFLNYIFLLPHLSR